ncbi:MAG: hypothetical protein HC923_12950 [Myxococcales bacterium]|nr:hypothetical protein [Myxococcales bacterium]
MAYKKFSLDKLNGSGSGDQTVLQELETAIRDLAQGVSDPDYAPTGTVTLTVAVKREGELVSLTPKIAVRSPRRSRTGVIVMPRDNGALTLLEEEQIELPYAPFAKE